MRKDFFGKFIEVGLGKGKFCLDFLFGFVISIFFELLDVGVRSYFVFILNIVFGDIWDGSVFRR